jgi:hypothetical protein
MLGDRISLARLSACLARLSFTGRRSVEPAGLLHQADRPIPALEPALGDRTHLRTAFFVRCNAGAMHPTEAGSGAAPDLAQGPVAKQVPVQVDLVVAGLLGINPRMLLRGVVHVDSLSDAVAHPVSPQQHQPSITTVSPKENVCLECTLSRRQSPG